MKGNPIVIEVLNALLADELSAIDQYMVHAEMYESWGYTKLAEKTEKRAITEMKHAEKHISRILFLEGRPIVTAPIEVQIGEETPQMFQNDCESESKAILAYNRAIQRVGELNDYGTQELLKSILKDEEDHIDWIEAQIDQIKVIGLSNYLVEQTGE
ncbi:MAG: bacterioferritin [Chloroflexi bacterium]|nr:bacterioferritin [Anaerolineaceae bacterium]NMB86794.1 bacterioferritin [Chloroflexota bacterium]